MLYASAYILNDYWLQSAVIPGNAICAAAPMAIERVAPKPAQQWQLAMRKRSAEALNTPKSRRAKPKAKVKALKPKRTPPRRVVWLEAAPSAPRPSATIYTLQPNSIQAKIRRALRDSNIAA